ncbi:MAG TPA: hypothetical protein VN696_06165 [Pyrinomonadaceae bacterium]|nr:hypothetical protein [Pyrinomonadaceae bacterium]
MKYCPSCNFSFPDFHLVCDFDGTELVPDLERLSLIKTPPRRTLLRRFITSPELLTALAILTLFLSTAFFAYYQDTSRETRTADVQVPPVLLNKTPHVSTRSDAWLPQPDSSLSSVPRAKNSTAAHRLSSNRPSVARLRLEKRNEHPSPQMEVARGVDPPSEKQPKLTAMLKTTWRVIKKPFGF